MAALTTIAVAGAITGVVASTANAINAGVQANKAKNNAETQEGIIKDLESTRQKIVNPYANITNEYANLGVATQASEFQAEEADIALANTLDTLRATGASAGGATALAQAALQSKRGISASIQQQEMQNAQLAARGAMSVQQQKAAGEQWKLSMQENRELQQLDRAQALYDNERAIQMQQQGQMWSAIGQIPGQIMSGVTNYGQAKNMMQNQNVGNTFGFENPYGTTNTSNMSNTAYNVAMQGLVTSGAIPGQ